MTNKRSRGREERHAATLRLSPRSMELLADAAGQIGMSRNHLIACWLDFLTDHLELYNVPNFEHDPHVENLKNQIDEKMANFLSLLKPNPIPSWLHGKKKETKQ